jgi:deazaflavin-dependent oxidoreductase (nitroreductase family)
MRTLSGSVVQEGPKRMNNIGTLCVRGRRTGTERSVRLRYTTAPGGSLLISAGGLTEQWPLNLRANPNCQFEIGGERRAYLAVEPSRRRFRLDPV